MGYEESLEDARLGGEAAGCYAALLLALANLADRHATRGCPGCSLCQAALCQGYVLRGFEAAIGGELPPAGEAPPEPDAFRLG